MNLLFILKNCPYCIEALHLMEEAVQEYPELASAKNSLRIVDENKEKSFAASFDYFYVPTFYKNGKKLHEGGINKKQVVDVLRSLS